MTIKGTIWNLIFVMFDLTVGVIIVALFWALIVAAVGVVGLGANEAVKILVAL